jgi:hypothetical protein
MKKLKTLLATFAIMMSAVEIVAQTPVTPPNTIPVSRPVAQRSGQQAGISGAAIAAGVLVVAVVGALAVTANNSHSH